MSWRKALACVVVLALAALWAAEQPETVTLTITGMT